jgi:DNA-binding XRE family transcriptional regulator
MAQDENIVKKVCKELGITQKELAEIMGVNDGTIRKWSSQKDTPLWANYFIETILENKNLKDKFKKVDELFRIIDELKQ